MWWANVGTWIEQSAYCSLVEHYALRWGQLVQFLWVWRRKCIVLTSSPVVTDAPWHVREEKVYPFGCFLVFFCRFSVRHHFIQSKMHSGACVQKYLMTSWVRALLQWRRSWGGGLRELNWKWGWEREREKGKQVSRANSIKPVRHFSFVHSYYLAKRRCWVLSVIFQSMVSKWDFIPHAHCDCWVVDAWSTVLKRTLRPHLSQEECGNGLAMPDMGVG